MVESASANTVDENQDALNVEESASALTVDKKHTAKNAQALTVGSVTQLLQKEHCENTAEDPSTETITNDISSKPSAQK